MANGDTETPKWEVGDEEWKNNPGKTISTDKLKGVGDYHDKIIKQ
jgi:hypothetical protein